ncbi:hypothetical protein I6G97_13120 [Edwardsiella hoshinae]|uniref:hypothetical protein n=1 Tax=Edwardsiella hoshinae TaxID=93378 RepID=UPI0018D8449A|nr:hypothetical protein [Edwardsiella hoshinae]QPR27360.1 hypothetical protein I6G97_13120 [Edwardsiella hoshinae]
MYRNFIHRVSDGELPFELIILCGAVFPGVSGQRPLREVRQASGWREDCLLHPGLGGRRACWREDCLLHPGLGGTSGVLARRTDAFRTARGDTLACGSGSAWHVFGL